VLIFIISEHTADVSAIYSLSNIVTTFLTHYTLSGFNQHRFKRDIFDVWMRIEGRLVSSLVKNF